MSTIIKNPLTIINKSEDLNEVIGEQERLINELSEALEDRGLPETPKENFLTFFSAEPFNFLVLIGEKIWDGVLEYSTDKINWQEWDGTLIEVHKGRLYLRGTGNTYISKNGNLYLDGTGVYCTGNIENLLDYKTVARGEHPAMGEGCFQNLFEGSEALVSTPELPATTLSKNCYSYMFSSCPNLKTISKISATHYAEESCYLMFYDSPNIKISEVQTDEYPYEYKLPMGTTEPNALESMFYDTGGDFIGTPELNKTYYTSNIVN